MSGSILNETKHALGLNSEETDFDSTIIMHINTVLAILRHLGVGPTQGYMITDESQEWDEFYDNMVLNSVKSYVYLRVKLLLDPSKTGFEMSAFERQFQEMEFRIISEVDA